MWRSRAVHLCPGEPALEVGIIPAIFVEFSAKHPFSVVFGLGFFLGGGFFLGCFSGFCVFSVLRLSLT